MRVDDSSYATLGLRPGAGRAEVDLAYRRLIKIHHPDRNGGDGRKAAEINRAYTAIRRGQADLVPVRRPPMPVPVRPPGRVGRRPFWLVVLVVSLAAGLFAAFDGKELVAGTIPADSIDWPVPQQPAAAAAPRYLGTFDEPLHDSVIDAAIGHASDFHSLGDVEGARAYSQDCHDRLHARPNLVLFDACAAFDESTATLAGSVGWQSGPFSSAAVTSREMSAARALSSDMFSADSRLNQIRSRVELALLPRLDPAVAIPAR